MLIMKHNEYNLFSMMYTDFNLVVSEVYNSTFSLSYWFGC